MATDEVQALVDDLAERLQRSVVVADSRLDTLYNSAHFGDEDPARVYALLKRRGLSEAIGHILAQGVGTWTRPGIIPRNAELGLQARFCAPIRWRGELIAFIMVIDPDGTITAAEASKISTFADRVAPVLAAELHGGSEILEQITHGLVSHDGAVRRQALTELATTEISSDVHEVTAICLSLQGDAAGTSSAHVTASMRSAFKFPKPTSSRFQLGTAEKQGAVILIGGTRALSRETVVSHARRLLARVDELSAGQFKVVAGIGPTVNGLDRAHETAELASLAARAAELGLFEEVTTWEELGPYGPLLRIPAGQLGRLTLPAEVQRLLDLDRDGQFVPTLRAFLDAAGSAPAAAEVLHIHRTTLYYRLSRVQELLDVDLADGQTRLSLHLGIALLDLMPDLRHL
ncbi:PucR family transcriptional regulator [Nocardia carnea]|uniref:PucR family transcriptional regulator n=1 Tax=Nocardia carnea TaxID=37328 RepID=UPI002458002A|nr:helix-turn-helix domain-containing protein [Nocardia carnea]